MTLVPARSFLAVISAAVKMSSNGKMEWMEMFYLTTHSTHFIYGYMVSDIW